MNHSSPDLVTDAHIHQQLNENHLSYNELFRRFEKDEDGRIDIEQLIELLEKHGLETSDQNRSDTVRRIIDQGGGLPNQSSLSFKEFVNYVLKQESKLSLVFRKLAVNQLGRFDAEDLVYYFRKLGIKLDLEEAKRLVQKMGQDNSLEISYDEWRTFFLINPVILESITNDPHEMLRYWRTASHIDLGESNYATPNDVAPENKHWWKTLFAGGCAGAVSRTATAPLDRLKIIMQYLGSRRRLSIINSYRYLINEGGVRSLWRGNGMNVLKIIPETALRFTFFEETKKVFRELQHKDLNAETSISERFFAGAIAGFISQTAIYPLDVLKVRLCLRRTGELPNWMTAVQRIYKFEGMRAFWRGYTLNQIGIVPYAGFDLACYESLKRLYITSHNYCEPPMYVVLGCGAFSSSIGQLVTYPITLLRIRRQGQIVPLPHLDQSKARPLLPIPTMISDIWQREGLAGFYRGLIPNMLKVVPAVSISYLIYEKITERLNQSSHSNRREDSRKKSD